MTALKKFMFDNFVIADEGDAFVSPEEEKIAEVASEPMDFEDNEIEEAEEEVAEPPVQTYTQDELDSALLQAEQSGYEKGYKSAMSGLEQNLLTMLGNIDAKLMDIVVNVETAQKQAEEQFMKLNLAVFKKLLPNLVEEQAVAIVNKFIEDNFANFGGEAKLSFYLNPETIGQVQEQIARLAHIHDFEGKIALHKDGNLEKADCRIEWDNGGVEHLSNKLLEKVDNLLEENTDKN